MDDPAARIYIRPSRPTMDMATVLGLAAGFGLMAAAIFLGGSPKSFVNPPSILIVIGGTLAITTACYSTQEMIRTLKLMLRTFFYSSRDSSEAATHVLQIAEMARKNGILEVQNVLGSIQNEPFLLKGMSMVVDGSPGEEVESILRQDLQSILQRHARSASVLKKMSEFAPAMGLIGTLIGLVQMLSNLQDPSSIGPSMAVALLTTFYGVVLANMVFLPIAAKLERNSIDEALINNIYMLGASSIGRQENPRRLEMLLNSILPPTKRVEYFD